MAWMLQSLGQLLGIEPAPGTPAHRDLYMRSCKLLTDELAKPPAQRDVVWMVEEAKRSMRLMGEYHQVRAHGEPVPPMAGLPHPAAAAAAALLPTCRCGSRCCPATHLPLPPCYPCAAAAPAACLQAEAQAWRRDAEVWTQHLAACHAKPASACCPDFVRVQPRVVASYQARAALHEAWARQSTVRLQALQEGRPPPPAPPPRLELHLPAGVPHELPHSIDRCAGCQADLDDVSCRDLLCCVVLWCGVLCCGATSAYPC